MNILLRLAHAAMGVVTPHGPTSPSPLAPVGAAPAPTSIFTSNDMFKIIMQLVIFQVLSTGVVAVGRIIRGIPVLRLRPMEHEEHKAYGDLIRAMDTQMKTVEKVQKTMGILMSTIENTVKSKDDQVESVDKMVVDMDRLRKIVERIVNHLETQKETVEETVKRTDDQAETVEKMVMAMDRLTRVFEGITNHIDTQKETVEQIVMGVDMLAESVRNVVKYVNTLCNSMRSPLIRIVEETENGKVQKQKTLEALKGAYQHHSPETIAVVEEECRTMAKMLADAIPGHLMAELDTQVANLTVLTRPT